MNNLFNKIDIFDKQIADRCFTLNNDYPNLKRFLTIFEFVYNGIPWFILACITYILIEDDYWTNNARIIFICKIFKIKKTILKLKSPAGLFIIHSKH